MSDAEVRRIGSVSDIGTLKHGYAFVDTLLAGDGTINGRGPLFDSPLPGCIEVTADPEDRQHVWAVVPKDTVRRVASGGPAAARSHVLGKEWQLPRYPAALQELVARMGGRGYRMRMTNVEMGGHERTRSEREPAVLGRVDVVWSGYAPVEALWCGKGVIDGCAPLFDSPFPGSVQVTPGKGRQFVTVRFRRCLSAEVLDRVVAKPRVYVVDGIEWRAGGNRPLDAATLREAIEAVSLRGRQVEVIPPMLRQRKVGGELVTLGGRQRATGDLAQRSRGLGM